MEESKMDLDEIQIPEVIQGMKPDIDYSSDLPPQLNLETEIPTFTTSPVTNLPYNHIAEMKNEQFENGMQVHRYQSANNHIMVPIQYTTTIPQQQPVPPQSYIILSDNNAMQMPYFQTVPVTFSIQMAPNSNSNMLLPNNGFTTYYAPNTPNISYMNRPAFPSYTCNNQILNTGQVLLPQAMVSPSRLQSPSKAYNTANKRSRAGRKPGIKSSKYRGVSRHKGTQKWFATITHDHKQYYLGLYNDETHAARAYDVFARKLHGINARTNLDYVEDTEDIINVIKIY